MECPSASPGRCEYVATLCRSDQRGEATMAEIVNTAVSGRPCRKPAAAGGIAAGAGGASGRADLAPRNCGGSRTRAIRDAVRMQQETRAPGRHRRRVSPRLVAHGFPLPRSAGSARPTRPCASSSRTRPARSRPRSARFRIAGKLVARRDHLRRGFRLSEIGGAGGDDGEIDDPVAVDAALPRRPGGDRRRDLSRHGRVLARPRRGLCRGDRGAARGSAAPICSSTTPASPI